MWVFGCTSNLVTTEPMSLVGQLGKNATTSRIIIRPVQKIGAAYATTPKTRMPASAPVSR